MAKKADTHSLYLEMLYKKLESCETRNELFGTIVNAPFLNKYQSTCLDLGIIVLLLSNKDTGMIDRVALSDTELAERAVQISAKPFADIKIPLNHVDNHISQAINTKEMRQTENWEHLFIPALTPEQARFNQSSAGIESSTVMPLALQNGGALIFSCFQPLTNITKNHTAFMKTYAGMVSEHLNRFEPYQD